MLFASTLANSRYIITHLVPLSPPPPGPMAAVAGVTELDINAPLLLILFMKDKCAHKSRCAGCGGASAGEAAPAAAAAAGGEDAGGKLKSCARCKMVAYCGCGDLLRPNFPYCAA